MATDSPAAGASDPSAPPLATVEWDAEGRVAGWSPEAERLFGWRAEEVRGRRSAEWGFVHPGDRERVRGVAEQMTGAGARQTFSANRNLTRDGRVLHCEWYNTALHGADGRLIAQYSLVLDVTARVAAEERARTALAAAERAVGRTARLQALTAALSEALTPSQVAEAVLAQGVDAVRAAAASVVALSDDGEHLELLAQRGYAPEQVAAWSRFPLSTRVPLCDAVRSGEMVVVPSVEERHRRYPELARIPALYPFSLSVPFVSEGEPLGAMGLSFREPRSLDEEDRAFVLALARQCAQALRRARLYDVERRARAEAEAASRAKSVFLATMSHEIRTPINAVMGYADLLELGLQGTLTEGQLGYVGRIRASSRHLLGLVNDVLDFARVEAGETTVSEEPVPLAEAVADAAGMVLPLASSRGVALVEEPCDPAAACLGDPDRIRQILLNLLSNAVKFTRPGGRVIVRCRPAAEGEAASVEVEDTGIGIAPEHLERIFEPFTQVDDSHTREAGGTGLGLAISRRFAVLMGGDLTARSQPGTGSVFILRLPATSAAPAPAAEPRGPEAGTGDPALAAAGRALEEGAETVVDAWVARVADDPGIPSAKGLPRGQIEDHSTTFVTELGRSLAVLASGGSEADEADSASIQTTIAALHGAQRARLDFSAAEIGREYQLLIDTVEGYLREAHPGDDPGRALAALARMVDRAARVAVESHASVPRSERLLDRTREAADRGVRVEGRE